MNVIDDAVTQLKSKLGKGYDVRDIEDLPDKPSRATVLVGFIDYTPASNAEGSMTARFRFTLVSPLEDRKKAQAQVDGAPGRPGLLTVVLGAVRASGFVMTLAKPALVKEIYHGFAIEAWTTTDSPY